MEGLLAIRRRRRRQNENSALSRRCILKSLRDASNPFCCSVGVFMGKYRLNQQLAMILIEEIKPFLTGGRKCSAIPPEIKVLSALHFFAHGSDQKSTAGEYDISLSQPSLCRTIEEVSEALNKPELLAKYIKFPDAEERQTLVRRHYDRFGLPGVLGYIDGTHILIKKPKEQEEVYVNRKFQHSINVQIACDSDMKILNILARYPGSSHDSFIWRNSALCLKMQMLQANGEECWLLGDSGYPSECWLLTPILNADEGSREAVYTQRHIRARCCVERCIGVLKGRFRCLSKKRCLEYAPLKAAKIINACAVLHNFCTIARLPEVQGIDREDEEMPISNLQQALPISNLQQALRIRRNVINRLAI